MAKMLTGGDCAPIAPPQPEMATLCKLKKKASFAKDRVMIEACVADPKFVCRKCLRAANGKKFLCKAAPAFRDAV